MIHRITVLPITFAAALALAACGGGGESSSPAPETPSTEVSPDTTGEASGETVTEDSTGAEADDTAIGDGEGESGCDQVLTAAEIESILGTAPEVKGTGGVCQHIYADDAIGSLSAFSGSKADEAMDVLLTKFAEDETKSGALLDDGRGYVLDGSFERSVVVRGDSGRAFVFVAPDGLDVADIEAALQSIADLLLTR